MRWTSEERHAFLDGIALSAERQRALALAPLAGDTLHDAAAAHDRAAAIECLWEHLDAEWRQRRGELGSWPDPARVAERSPRGSPDPAQVAACQRAESDANAAWSARCAAVEQRDRLERQLSGRTYEDDDREAARFNAIYDRMRHELHERGRPQR